MRLNLVLAAFSATLPILFLDNSAIWPLHLFTVVIAMALLAIALFDVTKPVRHLKTIAWCGVLTLLMFTALLPTVYSIVLRHQTGPLTYVHDNPLQIEAAMNFLDQGKNPYREDYTNTPLAVWNYGMANGTQNMSLYHVVALPGHLELSYVTHVVARAVVGFYDERFLYLLAFVATLVMAVRLGHTSEERLRSVIFICLSPLLLPFFREGRNDILVFTFLLGSFLALDGRRTKLAALLLGIALTVKQFAWIFILPFVAVLLARTPGSWWLRVRRQLPEFAIIAVIVVAAILPFFLWDRHAFIDDVIRYPNGGLATSYPITGLGFSGLLLNAGLVKTMDYFPFWIVQLITTLPLAAVFLPRLARQPRTSTLVFTGTLLMFVWMYFARFTFNNYFGLMTMLAATGLGFWWRERTPIGRATTPPQLP